ncbi:YybH family protein [Hyphococcus sp.]|uniref:YybH family protein n=1 Tax=Hyphococcus sp. TaxID=2038636 RepID=UPI00208C687F|nr:MAG: ketosteroid isomerase [Marinicaulis sp.]
MNEDEKEIRKLVSDWMAATKAGDKAAVLDLIADDVLFLTPGQPPFGKKEFAGAPDNRDMPAFDGKSEILEMEVFGERAWIRNQITVEITPAGGGEKTIMSGQTLTLLRKESDGKWRLFRDANFVS